MTSISQQQTIFKNPQLTKTGYFLRSTLWSIFHNFQKHDIPQDF